MNNYNNGYNQNFNNQGYPQQNYSQPQQDYSQPQRVYPQQGPVNKAQPKNGWSWGAFMYSWIWGIANYTYLPLLSFVPILSLFWPFVCGACGHKWAMNSGRFKTVEEFNAVQNSWDRAGKFMFFISLIFVVIWIGLIVAAISLNLVD